MIIILKWLTLTYICFDTIFESRPTTSSWLEWDIFVLYTVYCACSKVSNVLVLETSRCCETVILQQHCLSFCTATRSLNCVDIQSLGRALGQLSVSQIEALHGTDVHSCVGTLGEYTGWTTQQTTALLGRFKEVSLIKCTIEGSVKHNIGFRVNNVCFGIKPS